MPPTSTTLAGPGAAAPGPVPSRGIRPFRILVAVALAGATLALAAEPAGATCVAPTIRHDTGIVDRDGTVRVIGTNWGDDCNDTGGGGSVLGDPDSGIEVVLVQGGAALLVAIGDADDDFGFAVDVPVPDELDPGSVQVVARSAVNESGHDATPGQLVVSERPPTGAGGDAPVRLGPSGGPGPTVSEADDGSGLPGRVVAAGAVVLAAGLVAAGVHLARRRHRT